MILPPFADDCNPRFPMVTQPYFDDHQVKKEHFLQQRLKQLAPPLFDGGRAILWYCHLCQKPWYEMGRTTSLVCLSTSQFAEIAQQLGADAHQVSTFPSSICPLCASLHLGGMPRIEEYPDGQGYHFTWDGITRHNTRLFCIVYTWNIGSRSELLLEVCSAPCDVPAAPLEQVRSVLAWLKTLPDPEKEEVTMLSESTMDAMSQCNTPQPGFSWCGYGWKSSCPLLGQVLVALGITFPDTSICSRVCWLRAGDRSRTR